MTYTDILVEDQQEIRIVRLNRPEAKNAIGHTMAEELLDTLTDFGKVVVFRSKPGEAEIWSALPEGAGADADPMAYASQACRWQSDGYECSRPKRKPGRFTPAAIDDPGIEIRP